MHELSIAHALLEQVEAVAAAHDARGVSRVRLRIGPLSGVSPAALETAFAIAAHGTRCAAAVLDLDAVAAEVRCRACDRVSPLPDDLLPICAHCGGTGEVCGGRELELVSVELQCDDAPNCRAAHARLEEER